MMQSSHATTRRLLLLVAERRAVRCSNLILSSTATRTPMAAALMISTQSTFSSSSSTTSFSIYNNPKSSPPKQQQHLRHTCRNTNASRQFATGTRGARGHGWFVNYRAGKGGRHLQGEYINHPSLEQKEAWNAAVMEMGSQQVYLDVVVEPRSSTSTSTSSTRSASSSSSSTGTTTATSQDDRESALTGPKHRLILQLASAVMSETTHNFVQLCLAEVDGLKGSLLYRFERNVGICGGDVLTNTGRTGKAAAPANSDNTKATTSSPLARDIAHDPLVLWHLPGTVTMTVYTVGQIDSRFVLCTQEAPHLDGIQRAFGQLTADSLVIVQKWQRTLLTRNGVPTSFDLIISDCGVLPEEEEENTTTTTTTKNSPDEAVA